jgi:hypothetical protein
VIRVYDGRSAVWVDLRLERVVVQRWYPSEPRDYAVRLAEEPIPGSEPCWQARWQISLSDEHDDDGIIAAGPWRPLRAMAERDVLEVPRAGEEECPHCAAKQLHRVYDRPAFVCAACGRVVPWKAFHARSVECRAVPRSGSALAVIANLGEEAKPVIAQIRRACFCWQDPSCGRAYGWVHRRDCLNRGPADTGGGA